ncbi:MAG: hypothetical protein MZV70_48570, partial [Desulfobacterales bacterium]|nr:hypothetical protein [Desulfobacterales bacterium]
MDKDVEDLLGAEAGRALHPADDDQGNDAGHGGEVGRVHQHHQADEQDDDRDEQVAFIQHDFVEYRQLLFRKPFQADRGGIEVDHEIG